MFRRDRVSLVSLHGVAGFPRRPIIAFLGGEAAGRRRGTGLPAASCTAATQAEPSRVATQQIVHMNDRFRALVEGDDVGPFQPHHVQRQAFMRRDPLRFGAQKFLQPTAEIAQRETLRWIPRQVGARQPVEFPLARSPPASRDNRRRNNRGCGTNTDGCKSPAARTT